MDGNKRSAAVPLQELENATEFLARHIGPSSEQIDAMLAELGHASLDELVRAIVPESIRLAAPLGLAAPVSEAQALQRIAELAQANRVLRSAIGMGYYGTIMPAVIARNVFENPAWYTAYTPYQAEISQGRLEAMLNFQTMIGDLTAMPIANASLLDEASAAAEAMMLARRSARSASNRFLVSRDCHPQTISVVRTRAEPLGLEVVVGDLADAAGDCFGALLQYPASTGEVGDHAPTVRSLHAAGALVAVSADLLALTVLEPPGRWGADIVVGSAQRFGVPMGFGGPHAGFLACREEFKRSMPGRLVGVSVDSQGQPALRLALQTREQHIRREKATSNICTAQVLLAVIAAMYAIYHGPEGLRRIAMRVHRLTVILAAGLREAGLRVNDSFFDTLRIDGVDAAGVHAAAHARGYNLRDLGPGAVGISLDETSNRDDVQALCSVLGVEADLAALEGSQADALPAALRRGQDFLLHPVFHRHQSETSLLRYLRELADRDLALDRTMIPLGSCTMKLNATSEMIPVSWPQFAALHPYAPADQSAGYRALIESLESMLAECTGYDRVSVQPNSGAQGEFAGLLAIRAYHRAHGQAQRTVCLIPESAHGTNPASASLAGMQVVVVACDVQGNIDLADLAAKARLHAECLAALMVTYPSTLGIFEESIREICDIVHRYGGQVYTDGANLNAMVGLARPADFGSDVSHLNLHKTFCIPHGGGGPGVGPVAVKSHLAPFLPGHLGQAGAVGMVSAANFGSASILPISWMYLTMMGAAGVTRATQVALLNANYLARKLAAHYPVLYSGRGGYVAHECILDLRPIKDRCGISAEDVAKRLMDYGFHAPTLSFPVPGTLMIEPTESESQRELDRFIDAMVRIRVEIRAVESGAADREDNPLRNAPHTAAMVTADRWDHRYSRELAAFPTPALRRTKYWPPVARVDNVYGDRNLVCACVPTADWSDAPAPSAQPSAAAA
ncbi:glycine decarboxylase, PLP-dependent, subunit (protein P) of glycine cleavage complex [Burkholderiales bacterium]|nr:glycine decarboxylase, PLP-dependent, subunit (protein P) of glycine cleavage complex [Burkholderiales bacterium]